MTPAAKSGIVEFAEVSIAESALRITVNPSRNRPVRLNLIVNIAKFRPLKDLVLPKLCSLYVLHSNVSSVFLVECALRLNVILRQLIRLHATKSTNSTFHAFDSGLTSKVGRSESPRSDSCLWMRSYGSTLQIHRNHLLFNTWPYPTILSPREFKRARSDSEKLRQFANLLAVERAFAREHFGHGRFGYPSPFGRSGLGHAFGFEEVL